MGKFISDNEKEEKLLQRMQELGLREEDLIEKFIKGSGPGGQKINKTSSCVYLLHQPTGIEVKCQESRQQALNRFIARRLLCDKYEEKLLGEKSRRQQEIEKIRRQKRKRSKRAKEKILSDKHKRADIKKQRSRVDVMDDD